MTPLILNGPSKTVILPSFPPVCGWQIHTSQPYWRQFRLVIALTYAVLPVQKLKNECREVPQRRGRAAWQHAGGALAFLCIPAAAAGGREPGAYGANSPSAEHSSSGQQTRRCRPYSRAGTAAWPLDYPDRPAAKTNILQREESTKRCSARDGTMREWARGLTGSLRFGAACVLRFKSHQCLARHICLLWNKQWGKM